jgi:hypothetical protein
MATFTAVDNAKLGVADANGIRQHGREHQREFRPASLR